MGQGLFGSGYIERVAMCGFVGVVTVCYKPIQFPSNTSVKVILRPSRFMSGEKVSKVPLSHTVILIPFSTSCLRYNNTQLFHQQQ